MSEAAVICVVDDDQSILQSLAGLLRSAGFRARLFSSAEEFLEASDLSNVRCLVLDLRMPGMDGLALQRRLNAGGYRIPIVVLSAHGSGEARAQALKAGAIAFLPKPFDPEILLRAVEAALGRPHTSI